MDNDSLTREERVRFNKVRKFSLFILSLLLFGIGMAGLCTVGLYWHSDKLKVEDLLTLCFGCLAFLATAVYIFWLSEKVPS